MSYRDPPHFYPKEKDPSILYAEWVIWMAMQNCWDYEPEFRSDSDYRNTESLANSKDCIAS